MLGHSLGAIKAIYAATHADPTIPVVIVAISPPRLSYRAFLEGPRQERFRKTMARAQANVDAGKPGALMLARFPFRLLITSAGYLEKYGPAERYNFLRFVDRLPCPTLFTYGELELNGDDVSFTELPQQLAGITYASHTPSCVTIPEADHLYTGVHDELADQIVTWLQRNT